MANLKDIFDRLKKNEDCVFLETNRFDAQNRKSLLFLKPFKVITCFRPEELREKLDELDKILDKGYYAAGFMSYEAGYAFEEALKNKNRYTFPLLWFGVYKKPLIYEGRLAGEVKGSTSINDIKPNISKKEYIANIKRIKKHIVRGESYEVNFCFKQKFSFRGSAYKLYLQLREKQTVAYSAFIKFGDYFIVSFSPELFFRKTKSSIETRPMKGTLKRGKTLEEDAEQERFLGRSDKDRSENLMIVDLLRNDLGRISKAGSVKAKELFKVEKYETLFQMISVIRGSLKKDISLYQIFKNIFPCGSVTGAPKIRTMRIIRELEKEPRLVYTGSIGYLAPKKEKGAFNVAIRTVVIDKKKKKGEMGIGSGIVYESDASSEYAECLLKSSFLTSKKSNFQLIETILVKGGRRCLLLKLHFERLKKSSKYFNFCYNEKAVRENLKTRLEALDERKFYKLRLLLSRAGTVKITCSVIPAGQDVIPRRVKISGKKTLSSDVLLRHKVSARELYNKEHKKYKKLGFYGVIFTNERDEITEGAVSNIIIKKGGFYYTPPLSCGLLNGVYRQYLINKKSFPLKEKTIFRKDVLTADAVYLCNSVRGLEEVKVI